MSRSLAERLETSQKLVVILDPLTIHEQSIMFFAFLSVTLLVNAGIALPLVSETFYRDSEILQTMHDDVEGVKEMYRIDASDEECSVCYEELGCFDKCVGVFNFTHILPYSPKEISTRFTIYSR